MTRSGGSASGAAVQYRTGSGGTAVSGVDYVPITALQLLAFDMNQTSRTFQVQTFGNTVVDAARTVQLLLSNPAGGATMGTPSAAMLTLTNDDSGGGFRFSASSYTVPETAGLATISVSRAGGVASAVTVQLVAVDGTAKLGADYGPPSVTSLTFAANETAQTVTVPILVNPIAAGARALTLKLLNPGGGGSLASPSTATLNITKVGIRFSASAYAVTEGPGSATITVNRAGTASGVTVQIQTQDDPAVAPADYTAILPPQTLTFSSGQTSKTVTVAIANNPAIATNRQLRLLLSNANGESLGTPAQAMLTILDKQTPDLQLSALPRHHRTDRQDDRRAPHSPQRVRGDGRRLHAALPALCGRRPRSG